MGEVLNLRCPMCGRLAPVTAWRKIVASDDDYLGLLQNFKGRGHIETVSRITEPEQLDWVNLNGFGVQILRDPTPSELLKKRILKALSLWLNRGWIHETDLQGLGLRKITNLTGLVCVSKSLIEGERSVTTKAVNLEF